MPYETLKIVLRRIAIWFCTAFLCFIPLKAQQQATLPGTYAPGDASVAYSKAWFPFSTPAALAAQQQSGIQILYENRYITKTLANKSLNLWFSTPYFNIGGSFTHFGYSSYHEMMGALTLARQLGEHVRLGVEVDYFSVYLSEIGEYHGAVTAQVGLQVVPCRHLLLGFNLFNPTFSSVKTDELSKGLVGSPKRSAGRPRCWIVPRKDFHRVKKLLYICGAKNRNIRLTILITKQ